MAESSESVSPSLAIQNPVQKSSDDSWLHIPKKKSTLHIVNQIPLDVCPYWVALTPGGSLSPHDILSDDKPLQEALLHSAEKGIAEHKPIMVANATGESPEFLYLIPRESLPKPDDIYEWVEVLGQTIQSWSPNSVGFYFAEELLEPTQSFYMQKELIRILIQRCEQIDFYLLKGKTEYNHLLNFALKIREALQKKEIDLFVYHL